MKITFVSNYFNHHQKPLSDALYRLTDGNYTFVATATMREDRRRLGYDFEQPGYELRAYESEQARREAMRLIDVSDVVIAGSADYAYIKDRILNKKLLFKYGERPLKKGFEPTKYLPRRIKWKQQYPKSACVYLLCASAFASWDYSRFGLFADKAYRWAYFTDVAEYENIENKIAAKKKNSLLWAGRFLDWKHPEAAIEVLRMLIDNGMACDLSFIGIGGEEKAIKAAARDYGIDRCAEFLGSMPPEHVRRYMEQAEIVLFTSDKQEGWGAVVNEAMNSGCAVIGSHAAGSVPFLINDGVNGMIYQSGNTDMLYEKTKYLLAHPEERVDMGIKAYRTISEMWNAEVAAERLITLAERIIAGEKSPDLFEEGPCSKAIILKDDWIKNEA